MAGVVTLEAGAELTSLLESSIAVLGREGDSDAPASLPASSGLCDEKNRSISSDLFSVSGTRSVTEAEAEDGGTRDSMPRLDTSSWVVLTLPLAAEACIICRVRS